MALYMNNTKVKSVYWNGAKAKKVYFNNVLCCPVNLPLPTREHAAWRGILAEIS